LADAKSIPYRERADLPARLVLNEDARRIHKQMLDSRSWLATFDVPGKRVFVGGLRRPGRACRRRSNDMEE